MESIDPKLDLDPELKKVTEETKRQNEKAEQCDKEATDAFEELKKLLLKEGLKLAANNLMGQPFDYQQTRQNVLREISASPAFKALQQQFFQTIFPVGGSLINIAANLYNAKPPIMNKEQRDTLMTLGKEITDIPYKVLSGNMDLAQGYNVFIQSMNKLTDFVKDKNNINIFLNAGATILESVHPIGAFVKKAVPTIIEADPSELQKNIKITLMNGLSRLAGAYGGLEKTLKEVATAELQAHGTPPPKN